ncbi:hypothetical protein [Streptomyces sp. A1-5]|uniref:hypothetical protein n=1 Tax=Streptomyces sp. A1-5 TaxID=2738410 RepID=UPI001F21B26D|nr:hypothetical protein [Streptomyces sp. A1-5]UJB40216.1 hypothetical protein HRD51_04465 [Streptomyces sp. A1-5]
MAIGRPGDPGDPDPPAILIGIGGALAPDHPPAAAAEWGHRLGIPQHAFLAALFAGNDDQVLIGRMGQEGW